MTRSKRLILLLGVLLVLVGTTALVNYLTPEDETTEETEETVILSLDEDSVTALAWSYDGDTISLEKTDDGWEDPDDEALPVDEEYPDYMVSSLESLAAARTIEDPDDLDIYGLEDPAVTVTVTADDETTELSIGDESSLGGEVYVSIGDGNVYLVDSTLLSAFSYGRYDIVELEYIPSMTDLTAVTVSAGDSEMELDYLEDSGIAYSDEYVWFYRSGDEYLPLGTTEAESFVSNVTGLTWLSCVSYDADDEELEDYGLAAPAVTVTVDYTETVTVETSETDDDGNAVTEEQENPATFVLELGDVTDEGCYARLSGSNMVYLADASLLDTLTYTTYEELRSSDILLMDWSDITGFDILLDGETYHVDMATETVTIEAESSSEEDTTTEQTVFYLDGEALDTDTVDALLSSLTDLESTGSADGSATERTSEITFIFYQDSDNWPEVELSFSLYDSSSCLVYIAGEQRLLADRTEISDIVSAARELLTETTDDDEESDSAENSEETAETDDTAE